MNGFVPHGEAREPDDVLDPLKSTEDAPPVAFVVSHTASFALRGVAHDGGDPADGLRALMETFAPSLEEWPAFCRELFGRLYDPEGCDRLPADALSTWAASAISAAEQQADWAELCLAAAVARSVAATATTQIATAVAAILGLQKKPPEKDAGKDPRAAQAEAESAAAELREAGDDEGADDVLANAAKATAAAVAHRQAIDTRLQKGRHALGATVRQAAQEATAAAATINALVGFGFSREGPGSLAQVAPGTAARLKVDQRLLKIILQAGRMREAQRGVKAAGEGRVDVVGIRPTGDLASTTSAWRSKLATPGAVGTLAIVDLLEEQAQGYQMRDRAPMVRGDVGILVDRSGSMYGEREIAARALGVAAFMSALADGRRVIAGSFAGGGWGTNRADCTVQAVMPGQLAQIAQALEQLCRTAGGGTDVDAALAVTVGAMRAFPGGMREPDILVITDGEFPMVGAPVLSKLEDRRLFGVFIDVGDIATLAHPEFHKTWSITSVAESFAAGVIESMREGKESGK